MTDGAVESVESFRARAREWLAANMPRAEKDGQPVREDEEEWARARELQGRLHGGGFAGICFPAEYGGLGLTPAHQRAFNEETRGYEMPVRLNIPTFSICAATLLDMGSEEQKRTHIAAAIRGEHVLCQFLSEPSGGSDLAGLITRAELQDDDTWLLNGAKCWSTWAYAADYALCLARTDWTVPKHRGLTMFLVPTRAPGVTLNRVRMVDGTQEFCEEFFDDVRLPMSAVVGEVNGGWAVASRQMFHERNSMGGGSPYASGASRPRRVGSSTPVEVARAAGSTDDPAVRELLGRWLALRAVCDQTVRRVSQAMTDGTLPPAASSMLRLLEAEATHLGADLGLRIAGTGAVIGAGTGAVVSAGTGAVVGAGTGAVVSAGTGAVVGAGTGAAVGGDAEPGVLGRVGIGFLGRQSGSLGGGTTEIARNVISERVLNMPREHAADRDVPFNEVKRGR
ncbi:acyl-CoA dehydrogenase family protein [Actinomadura sp. 7K507]|uniref:acyl-CoA dehydrogenase family protein n=1 Tax=Actinomadura sp. 7K507 TaxID=2530365 RepID=UPI0010446E60|nr:acyl-CoA dehydrogenase family protein [Actinomadura sp. 7K507]TDC85098.1 acyl-CoA dehydrogenase [Actinomadura sp. 7K507]